MNTSRFRWPALQTLLVTGIFAVIADAGFAHDDFKGEGGLRVMTYNVDEGTDFLPVQNATTPSEFLLAVGQTLTEVRATRPRERMQAIAHQIIEAKPVLVSLQEMDQISSGPLLNPATFTCGLMTLEFDMVQDLLDALTAQHAHYAIAVRRQQFVIPPTPGLIAPDNFLCASIVNNIVLLVRTDLEPSQFKWGNPQSGTYEQALVFGTPAGFLTLPRAWVAIDAEFHGEPFRFIGTHLESINLPIRRAQGYELRHGPGNTPLPTIVAMDSNAQAAPLPQDTAYVEFIGEGYQDVWADAAMPSRGFTCCQAQSVNNVRSQLFQRTDLILTHGPIKAEHVALFGAEASDKTKTGLWPSDHAGVAAHLSVKGSRDRR